MPKMRTRAKMETVASDRARRENVPRHILCNKKFHDAKSTPQNGIIIDVFNIVCNLVPKYLFFEFAFFEIVVIIDYR